MDCSNGSGLERQVKECLQRFSNCLPAMIWTCGRDGRMTLFNDAWLRFTGLTTAEALGTGWLHAVHPDDLEARLISQRVALEARQPFEVEYRLRRMDGEYRWVLVRGKPQFSMGEEFQGYIAVVIDITERKRMEDALRASEERFRIATESASQWVYECDVRSGEIQLYPRTGEPAKVRSLANWESMLHPEDHDRVVAAFRQHLKSGDPLRQEYRIIAADTSVRYYADSSAALKDDSGKPSRWVGVLRNITEQKQAHAAQARLAAIVQCSQDAMVTLDLKGNIQSWNAAAEKLYGYSSAEILGRPASDLAVPDARGVAATRISEILRGTGLVRMESCHARKDGTNFPVNIQSYPLHDAEGQIMGSSSIIRDLGEERRAKSALVESENRFRAIAQNSSEAITLINRDGEILYDSPGIVELLGTSPEERLGHPGFAWIHPDDVPYVKALHEELIREPGRKVRAQFRQRHRDGSWRWCDSTAINMFGVSGVGALVTISRDITDQKAMEGALRESEQRYRKLIEEASDAIFTLDLEGNCTSINSVGERLSGYPREELLGMNLRELAAPECLPAILRQVADRMGGGNPRPLEFELIARDGSRIVLESSGRLQFRDGVPSGILCIARDIRERKRMEHLEQNRRTVLELVAEDQPVETIVDRLMEMIEQYVPGSVACVQLSDKPVNPQCCAKRALVLERGYQGHLELPIGSGSNAGLAFIEIHRPEPWKVNEADQAFLDSMVKLTSVVLGHRQLTRRLAFQAQHDALTGLPNRMLLDDRLQQALALARRQGKVVALVYIDLDGFKFVNDTLGHTAGDALLQQVAQRLKGAVREPDTLARTGGDEFVAVLFGIQTPPEAEAIGQRLVEVMREPFELGGRELFASASVGLSLFPGDAEDAATLHSHADVAMYAAKNRGRNRYQRYSPEMNSASAERLEIDSELHHALERDELAVYYQPQIELASGKLSSMEALLRWIHPSWGVVMPGRFIPVAEESGLILPLSHWVIEEVCRQHREWLEAGHPPIRIAVNISAIQFARSNLADEVAQVLARFGVEPTYLELELTEGVLMRDFEDSARQIAALQALGVSISIDDFGTGYSSLSYLQHLPINDLKIDRCFVQGIDGPANTKPLVQAIVGLAHGLNMTATAEGVEKRGELEVLKRLGCDRIQGYLVGRPGPAAEMDRFWGMTASPLGSQNMGPYALQTPLAGFLPQAAN